MNRVLVSEEKEIVALVVAALAERTGPEAVEELLGVEFATRDGRYPSDVETVFEAAEGPDDLPLEEDEDLGTADYWTYRYGSDPNFPATYPALVLYEFERGSDRFGNVESRVLLYVERHEFTPEPRGSR